MTRLVLNDLTQESPGKIVCLFWESDQTMECSGEPTAQGAVCEEGADHSSGQEWEPAAYRGAGPEGPGVNASVCGALVPKGLIGSCSSSLSLKALHHEDPLISPRCFHPGLVFHYH